MAALRDADVSRWPPAWAVNDRYTELWAVNGELAFPLEPSGAPGRFVAIDLPVEMSPRAKRPVQIGTIRP